MSTQQQTMAGDDARWAAVCARSQAADGQFYYSVRSTGVYCRPSCPSRTPRRAPHSGSCFQIRDARMRP
jgi:AraC family transcriptional regulator of adaptative response/methylated-DNA-[protein]-cysteine methyltransferase